VITMWFTSDFSARQQDQARPRHGPLARAVQRTESPPSGVTLPPVATHATGEHQAQGHRAS